LGRNCYHYDLDGLRYWEELNEQVLDYVDVPMLLINTVPNPGGLPFNATFLKPWNFPKLAEAVNDAGGTAMLITVNTYHSSNESPSSGVHAAWYDFANRVGLPEGDPPVRESIEGVIAATLGQNPWDWLFDQERGG